MSISPKNFIIIDGAGIQQTFRTDQSSSDSSLASHHVLELNGSVVSSSNPLPVLQGQSTGTDYSVNAASIPIATYVLLQTIPVATSRNSVEVQNQSASQLQIVLDDGSGNNQGSILIGAAAAANSQGGSWSSTSFLGRIRIYGPSSGLQVYARTT